MSEKISKAKTTAPRQVKKTPTASKAIIKKAPTAGAAAARAPKIPAAGAVQEKKAKKTKKTDSKSKMVRDNFSMPQSDYEKIDELKQLCLKSGMQVKKNQLLRAGLNALGKLSAAQLKIALSNLDKTSE